MSRSDEEASDAEVWREMKARSKDRRAANRETSADLLRSKGVAFKERNHGAHLLVEHGGKEVDFWPGTGKWMDRRDRKIKNRGVFRLLNYLGVSHG